MSNLADLTIVIGVDDKLSGPLDDAEASVAGFADRLHGRSQRVADFGAGMQDAGKKMSMFATIPIGAAFAKASSDASDLNESVNAVNVTFGEASDGVLQLGESAADTVGLSAEQFNGLAVRFSSFASTVAGDGGDVVGTLDDLTVRAADFASVMNLDVNDAARIFQSGLAGETEPLRQFGIDLSAAAVEAYALEKGIVSSSGELDEAAKVQARYGLLMESTSQTAGDFAATSEDVANAQRRAAANAANLSAEFGQKLLPIKTKMIGLASSLLDRFDSMSPSMKTAAVVVAGVVAAMGPLIFITGTLVRSLGEIGKATSTVIGWFAKKSAAATTSAAAEVTANNATKTSMVSTMATKVRSVGTMIAAGASYVASMLTTAAVTVANWIRMGAVALAQGARTAAGFVIAMGPVGWVIATVVALVALIVANWDTVVEWTRKAWTWVTDKVGDAWAWIKDTTSKAVSAVVGFFTSLRDKAVELAGNLRDRVTTFFGNLRDAVVSAATALRDRVVGFFTGLRDRIVEIVSTIVSRNIAFWGGLVSSIVGFATSIRDRVVSTFTGLRDRVVETIGSLLDRVRSIKDTVVGFFAGAGSWLLDAGRNIVQGLIDGIGRMIGSVGRAVSNVVERVTDYLPWSPAKTGPLRTHPPELAGRNIAEMLAGGITSGAGMVASASGLLAGAATVDGVRVPGVSPMAVGGDGASAGDVGARLMQADIRAMRKAMENQARQPLVTALGRIEHLNG